MYSTSGGDYPLDPRAAAGMNSWEVAAIQAAENGSEYAAGYAQQDPLIYPGLYAPSGFNMLDILFRVTARPNPQVDIGAVDSSCAIVLCDLTQPDTPIVYASEPFMELTGYSADEVMGRNCRFLQAPPDKGSVRQGSARRCVPKDLVKRMRWSVECNKELQVEVPNFRKDGTPFTNLLTMIPISWDGSAHHHYSVGFLCAKESL